MSDSEPEVIVKLSSESVEVRYFEADKESLGNREVSYEAVYGMVRGQYAMRVRGCNEGTDSLLFDGYRG